MEKKQLPIAYAFTLYKGARLFERILQAIYMPNNLYCIHIDKKSPEVFRKAIQAMIRCLPNVFISENSTDVAWGHFTVVQAQLNCMEELLEASVKWKYYISLVGQDFPLYDNRQIVKALQGLNNSNSINSNPMPPSQQSRTKFAHILEDNKFFQVGPKSPPPHNISIYKGSTHIVAIREFVEFVLHSQIGKDFIEFLKDTFVPDETLYASLQQHLLTPGGIRGVQPEWIPRALYWLLKTPVTFAMGPGYELCVGLLCKICGGRWEKKRRKNCLFTRFHFTSMTIYWNVFLWQDKEGSTVLPCGKKKESTNSSEITTKW